MIEIPTKPSGNIKFDNMAANNFTISFVTTSKGGDIETYIIERNSGDGSWLQVNFTISCCFLFDFLRTSINCFQQPMPASRFFFSGEC